MQPEERLVKHAAHAKRVDRVRLRDKLTGRIIAKRVMKFLDKTGCFAPTVIIVLFWYSLLEHLLWN